MIQEPPTVRPDRPDPREIPSESSGRYQPPVWVRVIGILLLVGLGIPVLLGLVAGGVSLSLLATPPASATTDQTFSVTSTPTLHLDVSAADITIVTGGGGQVMVHGTATARGLGESQARDAVNEFKVTASQAGDTITLSQGLHSFGWPLVGFQEVKVTLTVPPATNLSGSVSAGTLHVSGLQGTVDISNGAGLIDIEKTTFSSGRIETSAGNITLTDSSLNNVRVITGVGNIALDNVNMAGSDEFRDSAGDIDVAGSLASHSSLVADTSSGSVKLRLPTATDAHLNAHTSSGKVTVSGWPISVSQDTAAESAIGDMMPTPTSTILLTTDSGNIEVMAR